MEIGINTFGLSGALRRDFDGTLARLKDIGVTGIEPCVVFPVLGKLRGAFCRVGFGISGLDGGNWFGNAYARTEQAIKAGLSVKSVHCALCAVSPQILEKTAAPALDYAEAFGLDHIVVSLESHSPEAFAPFASPLARFAEQAARKGKTLLYHNHSHELSERNALDAIMQTPSLGLELDVGWATWAGKDPTELMRKYSDKIAVIHLKDIRRGEKGKARFAAVGEGDVPLAEVLKLAGGLPLIIDQDASKEDIMSDVKRGAKNIRRLLCGSEC